MGYLKKTIIKLLENIIHNPWFKPWAIEKDEIKKIIGKQVFGISYYAYHFCFVYDAK
jgi:hypothetical protein